MKESRVEFAEIKLILDHFYLNLLSPHSPQYKQTNIFYCTINFIMNVFYSVLKLCYL